ncbi:hypothetical protein [Nocardia asteroides]|uniref:hypothetical protein n=1 Tax=Nocardia asteroides TaxID=1824 RepID=UPI00366149FB
MLSDDHLDVIEARCAAASPGPWTAFVEARDDDSGDDFIRVGDDGNESDMYVSRELLPAAAADLDFIASAPQDIPTLVAEIRRLRAANG